MANQGPSTLPLELLRMVLEQQLRPLIEWINRTPFRGHHPSSTPLQPQFFVGALSFWRGNSMPNVNIAAAMLASSVVQREILDILFRQAVFRMVVGRSPHRWFDASRPALTRVKPGSPLPNIQNLRLDIEVDGRNTGKWLTKRMRYRKRCVFFDEMPSLRTLKITACRNNVSGSQNVAASADLDFAKDLLYWILEAVPANVEVSWLTRDKSVAVDEAALRAWFANNRHVQGSSPYLVKSARAAPVDNLPAFYATWEAERRRYREYAKS